VEPAARAVARATEVLLLTTGPAELVGRAALAAVQETADLALTMAALTLAVAATLVAPAIPATTRVSATLVKARMVATLAVATKAAATPLIRAATLAATATAMAATLEALAIPATTRVSAGLERARTEVTSAVARRAAVMLATKVEMLAEMGMAATAVAVVARTGEPKGMNPIIARLPERLV
jgi:hypothetical protein